VVASRKLDFDGYALAGSMDQAPLWLLHGSDAPKALCSAWLDKGAKLIEVPSQGRLLTPMAMLHALGDAGLTSVYCEGGGALAASMLQADVVDDLLVYHAGLMIGAEGRPGLGALERYLLSDCPRFDLVEQRSVGGDMRSHWCKRV